MTTIAYSVKAKTMAGDTKISGAGINNWGFINKVKKIEGYLIGCCGSVEMISWFMNNFKPAWMKRKNFHEDSRHATNKDDDFEALVVSPRGKIFIFEEKLVPFEVGTCGYVAIGSGAAFAVGAMYAGASPDKAVSAAIRHDETSGGRVVKIHLEAK